MIDDELIVAYVEGQLPNTKRQAFENLMQQDQLLKQKVLQYNRAYKILVADRRIQLLQTIQQLANKEKEGLKWPKRLRKWSLGILKQSSKKNDTVWQIVLQQFTPYPAGLSLKGVNEPEGKSPFYQAITHYNQGNYSMVISLLEALPNNTGIDTLMVNFYLGNAYLANQQPIQAIQTFSNLLFQNPKLSHAISNASEWYLALAYLGSEQQTKAIQLLQHIADYSEDIFYQKKATETLMQYKNSNIKQ